MNVNQSPQAQPDTTHLSPLRGRRLVLARAAWLMYGASSCRPLGRLASSIGSPQPEAA